MDQNQKPERTFGMMKRRRRWLVALTDEGKKPAGGWRHPRSFTVPGDGRQVRKVVQTRREAGGYGDAAVTTHGVKVTSATPETWLSYAEALEVSSTQFDDGEALPAYVHGNPTGGHDEYPMFFWDCDISRGDKHEESRAWAKGVADELATLLPEGWPWMKSVSGEGRHLVTAIHEDDIPKWKDFFAMRPGRMYRRSALTPEWDPKGEFAKVEWWNTLEGGGRYRLVTDRYAHPTRVWPDSAEIPVLRYDDVMALPTMRQYLDRCAVNLTEADENSTDEEYPSDQIYERSDRGAAMRYLESEAAKGAPVVHVPGVGVFIRDHQGILLEVGPADGEGIRRLFRMLPGITDGYADQLEKAGRPKSARALKEWRRSRDTVARGYSISQALNAIVETDGEGGADGLAQRAGDNGLDLSELALDNRLSPTPVLRTPHGLLDWSTGQMLSPEATQSRLITSRLQATPYSPQAQLPQSALDIAAAVKASWGFGWKQVLWAIMHPMAKRFLVVVGDGNTGKSQLFELLQMLNLAAMADDQVITELTRGGRPVRFSRLRPLMAMYPLIVFDEVANQTLAEDEKAGGVGADLILGDNALKETSAAATVSFEAKHRQGTTGGRVQGLLVFIANTPPLINVCTPMLGSRVLAVSPPQKSSELSLGDLGKETIVVPEVAQALLRLIIADMPSVLQWRNVPVNNPVQDHLVGEMQRRWRAMQQRGKKTAR